MSVLSPGCSPNLVNIPTHRPGLNGAPPELLEAKVTPLRKRETRAKEAKRGSSTNRELVSNNSEHDDCQTGNDQKFMELRENLYSSDGNCMVKNWAGYCPLEVEFVEVE